VKRVNGWAKGLALVLAVAAPGAAQAQVAQAAAVPATQKTFSTAQMRQDLAFLADTLVSVHPAPFARFARADFDWPASSSTRCSS